MRTSKQKILFDTNILVYNQDSDSQFYEQSSLYHQKAIEGKIEAVISSQNLLEFSAIMINPKKITKPMSQKLVALELKKYIDSEVFEIIYPNLKTFPIFTELFTKYRLKNPRQMFDFFLMATMISNDIFQILTLNKKDFQVKGIKVVEFTEQK